MAIVGCNSFDVKRNPHSQSYDFKQNKDGKFEAIIYLAGDATGYPGFPVSPERLARELRSTSHSKRLKRLQVTMASQEASM